MCRIAGYLETKSDSSYDRRGVLHAMRDSLTHGGPDACGDYFDLDNRLALGHRRLSILDLSERANQPMQSESHVICYNGECYNFREIRNQIGYPNGFKTDSDTEVVLKGFQTKGREFVHQLRGMYSFAIWDKSSKELLLCRDRLGVKPLYWYLHDGLFMFASELKAFHSHPRFNKQIDKQAVATFLAYGYIPASASIYKHVRKLKPGHFLEIDENLSPQETPYWSAKSVYESPRYKFENENEAVEELESQLIDSVKLRMVSDVPVGMFLSGGVDSSLVTAILQKHAGSQLKTFTIGFESAEFNEAEKAKNIAEFLGTQHHELICTENDFASIVPRIPEIADEPFGGPSIIPTYLLSKFAREEVKVSLSADGGDELFGGYSKYEFISRWYPRLSTFPVPVRRMIQSVAGATYRLAMIRTLVRIPLSKKYSNIDAKISKLLRTLDAKDLSAFFEIASQYITRSELQALADLPESHSHSMHSTNFCADKDRMISYLGMLDVNHFLEGNVLAKVDRATMAVALEGRDPLLDQNLVEFGFSLPDNLKLRGRTNKYLLRKVLSNYVPNRLVDVKKYGFTIPIALWLRNRYSDELRALCVDRSFQDAFGFHEKQLNTVITSFLAGHNEWDPMLVWFIFVLSLWHRKWCV